MRLVAFVKSLLNDNCMQNPFVSKKRFTLNNLILMKNYIFIALFFFLQTLSIAQNCTQPLNNYAFQQKRNTLANQVSDIQRLNTAKQIANESCLSAAQVKELAKLFSDDYAKLEFAKAAYPKTTDKANFYEVYNAFSTFSTVFMLHDFVLEKRGTNTNYNPNNDPDYNPTYNPNTTNTNLIFPNYIYPNYVGYNGMKRCNFPMAETDFYQLALDVSRQISETNRIIKLDEIINGNCLTTAQAMKFASLLGIENNKLTFLKKSYNKIFDLNNFQQATQVFNEVVNRENLIAFLQSNGSTGTLDTNNPCSGSGISQTDMNDILARIKRESFNSNKINMAKSLIRNKKCFTSNQIKDIVMLFTFSDSKMDVAKFAYDFAVDKSNYYVIVDAFTFSTDRDNFMKFLDSK